jgi:hypothetical protein
LRFLAGTVAPALPTFGELTLNRFAATAAKPGLFYRLYWRQRPSENPLGLRHFLIVNHPEFRPTFDGRQFTCGAYKIEVSRDAPDAECRQNILQMADHQRVFSAVDPFHAPLTTRLIAML